VLLALVLGIAGTTFGLIRATRAAEAERLAKVEAEEQQESALRSAEREAAERQKAEAARAEAQAKEAEANAVVKFFEERVFAAGRPKGEEGGLGHNVALRDAIRASLPSLTASFQDQPLVEARLRMALGITFRHLGDHIKAAEQFEKARALCIRHLGPVHPNTLASITGLATSYKDLNRHAEALKLREETLAAQKRVLPADHPDTLSSMNNLANSYAALNRHAEALKLYEEALAAQKRVLPPDHPDTLSSMNNLASSYTALNRHAEALKLREETLAAQKQVLPPDHPSTLVSMNNLADSYVALNRHAEAVKLLDEVLAKANRPWVNPRVVLSAIGIRLQCCQRLGDVVGCRATTELLEKRNPTDVASMYNAACCRALSASLQAKAKDPDAARLAKQDADKAMAWLTKAVAAGFKNATHMRNDTDLDVLRERADFKKLLADLEMQ
jgi:tetratricopeptide (TPR) repeat protein